MNAEFQRIARRDKKAFLSDQCKEIGENIEWERLEISSRKLEIPREHFMQDGHNKGQKQYVPNQKQKRLRRAGKNTHNCTKKIFMTQITMMV